MTPVRPEEWTPQGLTELEPRAWEALRLTEESVLVTAGAGAGKTEFLAQKATYLLETGLLPAPRRILAISFKRDAARNLAERVAKRCPPEQARRFDSFTFDAFAKGLVDRFREAIPDPYRPPADYRIVTPFTKAYREFLDAYGFRGVNTNKFEGAVAAGRLPVAEAGSDLQRAVAAYWRAQYGDGNGVSLSFPMMNRLADLLMRSNPAVLKALRLTYGCVFLDEFQDTTAAQFQLLLDSFEGSKAIFTAVGDDKQRIMLWAGAMSDAFAQFERRFRARRLSLTYNWRSHEDLARIQYVVASRIDPGVEMSVSRAGRSVDGDVAAVWECRTETEEGQLLASWITRDVRSGTVAPHDVAILVRMRVDEVEASLAPALAKRGIRLRNVARNVGEIAIQDLLGEDLTRVLLRLLRLGVASRSPEDWTAALQDLQFLEAAGSSDETGRQALQERLQEFVRATRCALRQRAPSPSAATDAAQAALDFIGADVLRRAFSAYRRGPDFARVWDGFKLLLEESSEHADTWPELLDEFEGRGQVPLMTIHKAKGLEFHTMVFYGLDSRTWWSLTPDREEELNSFFVALTRAKQRAFFTLCAERGQPVAWIENLLAPAGVRRVLLRGLVA